MNKLLFAFLFGFVLLSLSSCNKTFVNNEALQSPVESYEVAFLSLWTEDGVHNFDRFPSGAHFSAPVVVSHSEKVVFWQEGALASKGVERIAEIGATRAFGEEVSKAHERGAVLQYEQGSSFNWDETESITIKVSEKFPLISVLTMIAPSPDWFVGLDGLSLKDERGHWKDYVECALVGYDAGTEDGTNYDLDNPESEYPQEIHKLADDVSLKDKRIILQAPYLLLKIKRMGAAEGQVDLNC